MEKYIDIFMSAWSGGRIGGSEVCTKLCADLSRYRVLVSPFAGASNL